MYTILKFRNGTAVEILRAHSAYLLATEAEEETMLYNISLSPYECFVFGALCQILEIESTPVKFSQVFRSKACATIEQTLSPDITPELRRNILYILDIVNRNPIINLRLSILSSYLAMEEVMNVLLMVQAVKSFGRKPIEALAAANKMQVNKCELSTFNSQGKLSEFTQEAVNVFIKLNEEYLQSFKIYKNKLVRSELNPFVYLWKQQIMYMHDLIKNQTEHVLDVQEVYFEAIASGQKTVEGRPNKPKYDAYEPGDILKFVVFDIDGRIKRELSTVINKVNKYDTIYDYLSSEGYLRAIPGSRNILEAAVIYNKWYSDEVVAEIKE